MLGPIDTRILTARPDHLTAPTQQERAAARMIRDRRHAGLTRLLAGFAAGIARRVNQRA